MSKISTIDAKLVGGIVNKINSNNAANEWNHFKTNVYKYIKSEWPNPTSEDIMNIVLQFVNNPLCTDIKHICKVITKREMDILAACLWAYLDYEFVPLKEEGDKV